MPLGSIPGTTKKEKKRNIPNKTSPGPELGDQQPDYKRNYRFRNIQRKSRQGELPSLDKCMKRGRFLREACTDYQNLMV